MPAPIHLLLGVHAHQPVGNFPEVLAEAHEKCYRPFLQILHRYPGFHFAAHFSGWLLDELLEHYPDDLRLLTDMVGRGQAELFGGGDCEPVLAAIPARDRVGQIQALSARLADRLGARPQGAWLTERVWESSVVPALADSDIRYVTVDDYHFLCTGKTVRELDSYYTTEEDGHTLDLFPISEALRYRLPFAPAGEVVAYLEQLADTAQTAAIYFDDIEKFGIWPETYEWVYERGWLEQFIQGVLASPKIATVTYAAHHASRPTRGIVYLPTTSYSEMNEWTLPAEAAGAYADLLQREKAAGLLDRHRPFIRGGIWRNFLSRYPEANWMHKRMLELSARFAASADKDDPALRALLYRAQANDAYWHGLFGGLYLPHLRRAVWSNLVALEAALDRRSARPEPQVRDSDHDGHQEIFLHNASLQAVLRSDGLGAMHEFDSYPLRHNFGDTLRRSTEHYYRLMDPAAAAVSQASGHDGIASAHDRVSFKHHISGDDLIPDRHGRCSFMDSLVCGDGTEYPLEDYGRSALTARTAGFSLRLAEPAATVSKEFRVDGTTLAVTYRCEAPPQSRLRATLHLALPSCDGFGGRYVLADGNIPCGFGQVLELAAMREIWLEDSELRGRLILRASRAVAFAAQPHMTVSQSEAGFEKIMQAARLELSWPAARPITISISVMSFD